MTIKTAPNPLADADIRTQARPAPQRELQAGTAITAGRHTGCYRDTKAEAQACCDALPNTETRSITLNSEGEWFCLYADSGTGDWD